MTFKPANFAVWFELPVSDLEKATRFYNTVFMTELNRIDDMGPNSIAMFPYEGDNGVAGHLYPGKPPARGAGPTIHLACPDSLEATVERFGAEGGEIVSEPVAIPSGRFVYGLDPDGNSVGMFFSNPK